MKRRTFLQHIGGFLAVLGITEAEWLSLGNNYYQALAQTSSRKLALLVGINNYSQFPTLNGCLTDVELQKQLLIHRFGFQLSDILCLTDEQASKSLIQKAFNDLNSQVQPGDVVYFHFSGYSTYVKSQKALILFDDSLEKKGEANYLLEETLQLILHALKTENVIAVLDTGYNINHSKNCGLKVRTVKIPDNINIANDELEYQKQLKSQAITTPPALILSATSNPNQSARELQMSGFSTGLFTYALTQYLWENSLTTTVQFGLQKVNSTVQQLGSNQQSTLINSKKIQQLGTFASNFGIGADINIQSEYSGGAEGAITSVEEDGKAVQLWLGGVPAHVLEYMGANSRFAVISNSASSPNLVLRVRSGLTAKASLRTDSSTETSISLQVGQLIQEVVRVIPKNIHLNIGLDKLERIERVDATSAFATLNHISSTAAEQPTDYIFGKLLDKPQETGAMVSSSRYGLFSLSGELIANTSGEVGEAVKVAAQRLAPKLQTLLAAKLWRITENEASSLLNVKVTLETVVASHAGASSQPIMIRESFRGRAFSTKVLTTTTTTTTMELNKLSIGNRIQYKVENKSNQTLYLMLLGLDSSKNAFALYAWHNKSEDAPPLPSLQNITIEPGATTTVPQTNPGFEWIIQGLSDSIEVQLILSTAPFTQTLAALSVTKVARVEQQRIVPVSNPSEVAVALLQDLHDAYKDKKDTSDAYVWNVNNWASFSFVFQAQ
ncbi:Peptidase C14, caspase catalytic subunit p20 [Rivularia sp. IAM M-261]|nr:Peptidase C14, caspase catalytic subunit p20 [Calothrix sp. PCC 7716]GJD17890.1 Peptidase C14, caspase catalytic subunit p20 [Rivularia sp. IAM M-261]